MLVHDILHSWRVMLRCSIAFDDFQLELLWRLAQNWINYAGKLILSFGCDESGKSTLAHKHTCISMTSDRHDFGQGKNSCQYRHCRWMLEPWDFW